ncbi:hypothetical protein SAMN04488107_1585 [Geodermatophilus saharensis]|uniref:Uncharacterized protein n=1 Tax=Geodermatophilus saharensis TaxID=1137994 RepID=A0A239C392_9ACTN|nr:hypothetical protein [Geodermatophilus saharensis]SNS14600.1 hypothetical protein SAMN04488107_1585 [Geodermatophilus saharensis]
MTDNRYRVPEDAFLAGVRVPVEEQVEVQAEPVPPPADWRADPVPWADGGSGDVDGD